MSTWDQDRSEDIMMPRYFCWLLEEIGSSLMKYWLSIWNSFLAKFGPNNSCRYHYSCPCRNCFSHPKSCFFSVWPHTKLNLFSSFCTMYHFFLSGCYRHSSSPSAISNNNTMVRSSLPSLVVLQLLKSAAPQNCSKLHSKVMWYCISPTPCPTSSG